MSKNKNTHEYKNTQEHTKTHCTQHPQEISSFHALGQKLNKVTKELMHTNKTTERKKEEKRNTPTR